MKGKLKYRLVSFTASLVIVLLSLLFSNQDIVQQFFAHNAPVVSKNIAVVLSGTRLYFVSVMTLLVFAISLSPLYKPQPRRTLDTVFLVQKRVVLASFALATIGYYDYTYTLPRPHLIILTGILFLVLPLFFLYLNRSPEEDGAAVLVGNDSQIMTKIVKDSEIDFLGYISPYRISSEISGKTPEAASDGGLVDVKYRERASDLEWLGSLTMLDELVTDLNIDTAVLAFDNYNRSEFFGVLEICHDYGVEVMAHWEHVMQVLVDPNYSGESDIVQIDLEPLDPQDYLLKRLFDVVFSVVGFIVLSPVILIISIVIKLDSPGPVLYRQERTAEFGDTIDIHKFRTMTTNAEDSSGPKLSEEDGGGEDPRVTRVGRFLRMTHLDVIPQLGAVLRGDMSVVGPRPERPELESRIETGFEGWRRRWFIKPGLTGLAQINGVTGVEPGKKLRYDLQYIRDQSFRLDVKIVAIQIWMVVRDTVDYLS